MSTFTPYEPTPTTPTTRARRSGLKLPRAGMTVALVSLWLGIIWVAAVPPMNAPDEPAYLQAVMETRNKRMLPEIHFDFSRNPLGDIIGDPGDQAAVDYAARHNMAASIRLVPYQNSQPPLYSMIVGSLAMLLPSDPQIILYVSRLISVLFGAGTVLSCWAAAMQMAPRSPMWAVGVAGAAGAALMVFGWWLVRNWIAYGEVTGTAGVNRFYKANLPGINLAVPDMRAEFIQSTWQSFWGFFGWQDISMPDSFYSQAPFFTTAFFGLTGLAALGTVAFRFARWRHNKEQVLIPAYAWQVVSVLALVGIALVVAFVQYSLQVAEAAQGRYLYLMLLPVALLFTGSLYALPPHRILKVIALSVPILWLAAMNFVGLSLV